MPQPYSAERPGASGQGAQWIFGTTKFTEEDHKRIQEALNTALSWDQINSRPAGGGKKVHYLAGHTVIEIANKTFGFDGWDSSILHLSIDYVEKSEDGRYWTAAATAIVRVALSNGSGHEDVGNAHLKDKDKGEVLERVKKAAVTDATKRALRLFGRQLGGNMSDKEVLTDLERTHKQNQRELKASLQRDATERAAAAAARLHEQQSGLDGTHRGVSTAGPSPRNNAIGERGEQDQGRLGVNGNRNPNGNGRSTLPSTSPLPSMHGNALPVQASGLRGVPPQAAAPHAPLPRSPRPNKGPAQQSLNAAPEKQQPQQQQKLHQQQGHGHSFAPSVSRAPPYLFGRDTRDPVSSSPGESMAPPAVAPPWGRAQGRDPCGDNIEVIGAQHSGTASNVVPATRSLKEAAVSTKGGSGSSPGDRQVDLEGGISAAVPPPGQGSPGFDYTAGGEGSPSASASSGRPGVISGLVVQANSELGHAEGAGGAGGRGGEEYALSQDFSSAFGEIDSAIQRHTESLSAGSGGGDATAAGSGGGGNRDRNGKGPGNVNASVNASANSNANSNANGNRNGIVINSRRDTAIAEPRNSLRTLEPESNAAKYVRTPLGQVGPAVPGAVERLNNVAGNGRVPKGTGIAAGIGRVPPGGRGTERVGYGDGRGNMTMGGSSNGPERTTGHKRLRT